MSEDIVNAFDLDAIRIEVATDDDLPEIQMLFRESLEEGQLRTNDTGADIENLAEAYLHDDGQSGFWVARQNGVTLGMVGVQQTGDSTAEIRRLRVRSDHRRRGIGTKLMEHALTFCKKHSYLKVTLDVRIERLAAIALFENFGFRLGRSRDIDGRKTLDFLLDLYTEQ